MIEMDIADDDIDLYGGMSSPERTSDSSEEDEDIHPRIQNPTRNRSPMASETDEFVMEALGEIFWDTREAIIDNTEDGDDPDFDPLVETALNCIRNYDVIRASAQALLNDHRNDELVLDSGDSEAGHSRWYTGRSRGGSSPTASPSRWTRLPDFSPSSCSSVSVTSPDPRDDPQLTITALTDDKGEVTADRNEHTYSLNTADKRDDFYRTEGFDPHANYNNPDRNEHTYSLNIEDNRDDFYRTEGFDLHANYNNPDRNEHTYSLNIVDNRDKLYPTEGFDPHANYNNPDRNEHTYSLNIEDNRDEFYPKEGFNPHAYYDNPDHTYTRFARPQAASDTVTGDASGIDILETALQDENPTFNWKLANEWAKMTANVNVNSEPGPSCNINPPHGTVHSGKRVESHYANMPMQYTEIFFRCKNKNFQLIFFFFLFLLKT